MKSQMLKILLGLVLLLALVGSAQAQVISDRFNIGMPDKIEKHTSGVINNETFIALQYIPSQSFHMDKVGFATYGTGYVGYYNVTLRTDAGGYPSSTILAQNTNFSLADVCSVSGTAMICEVPLSYDLTAGTKYWFVFHDVDGGGDGSGAYSDVEFACVQEKPYGGEVIAYNITLSDWLVKKSIDGGATWNDIAFSGITLYGVVWAKNTTTDYAHGQFRIRADTMYIQGTNHWGQHIALNPVERYYLSEMFIYIWDVDGVPPEPLSMVVRNETGEIYNNSVFYPENFTVRKVYKIPIRPVIIVENSSYIDVYFYCHACDVSNRYVMRAIQWYTNYTSWDGVDSYRIWDPDGGTNFLVEDLYDVMLNFTNRTYYYIAPLGNNSNDGLEPDTPWRSLSYACDQLQLGDTLWFINGSYSGSCLLDSDGMSDNRIELKKYNGTITIVNTTGDTRAFDIQADNIVLDGFEVDLFRYGVYIYSSSNIVLRNVSITNGEDGITVKTNSSDIFMDNVTVANMSDHGILLFGYPYDSAWTRNITIQNCEIRDTSHNGVDIHTNANNVTVRNCMFYNVTNSAGVYSHNSGGGNNYNIVVEDNLFVNNTRGVWFIATTDSIIRNNTINDSTQYGIFLYTVSPYYKISNITLENNKIFNSTLKDIYLFRKTESITEIALINNTFNIFEIYENSSGVTLTYSGNLLEIGVNEPKTGEILNFTANSTTGNNVTFTICNLTPNQQYTIQRSDGYYFNGSGWQASATTVTANASGCLVFWNSEWSEKTFEITQYSSGIVKRNPFLAVILTLGTAGAGAIYVLIYRRRRRRRRR